MTQHRYHLHQRVVQAITSSRLGARVFSRLAHRLDRVVLRLSGERRTLSSLLTGTPVLVLTTTGAQSGQPRTTPLLYIRDPDDAARFALIASNWGGRRNPGWYYNLQAHPQATCAIRGETHTYRAHEAEGVEYERFWALAARMYPGYPKYKDRASHRHIPIMIMTPVEA